MNCYCTETIFSFCLMPATPLAMLQGEALKDRERGYSEFITGANRADLPSTAVLPQPALWHLRTAPAVKLSPSPSTSIHRVAPNLKTWINSFSLPSFLKLGNHAPNQPVLQLEWNSFSIKHLRVADVRFMVAPRTSIGSMCVGIVIKCLIPWLCTAFLQDSCLIHCAESTYKRRELHLYKQP